MPTPKILESPMNVSNHSTTNFTTAASPAFMFHPPDTTAFAWITTGISFFALVFNGMLIFAYCTTRALRTPFGVYIISLSCGDVLETLIMTPYNIVTFLEMSWPLGKFMCGLVFYSGWAVIGFTLNIHVLISLNRLWAVTFPNSYRLHHNRRVAMLVVVALVVYVNLWTLPGFVVYALRYLSQEGYSKKGCTFVGLSDMLVWLQCVVITMYLIPNVLIMVIYPLVYRKVRAAERTRQRAGSVALASVTSPVTQSESLQPHAETGAGLDHGSGPHSKAHVSGSVVQKRVPKKQSTGPPGHFMTLTLLVTNAIFCWTPVHVAYALMLWNLYFDQRFIAISTIIYFVDALLNPLVYPLAAREWRDALRWILRL